MGPDAAIAQAREPGWKLHALGGDLSGHWSVWVSGNWRLTFMFDGEEEALRVEVEGARADRLRAGLDRLGQLGLGTIQVGELWAQRLFCIEAVVQMHLDFAIACRTEFR